MSGNHYWVYADGAADDGIIRKFSYGVHMASYYAAYTDMLGRLRDAGLRLVKHTIVAVNPQNNVTTYEPPSSHVTTATASIGRAWYEDTTHITIIPDTKTQVESTWR
jgi:hypothetical protein